MLLRPITKEKRCRLSESVFNNTLCEILSLLYVIYSIHGNIALLVLKVAEWGKILLEQPQEWMSAVLSSTYLDKGEIHLMKNVLQKQTEIFPYLWL